MPTPPTAFDRELLRRLSAMPQREAADALGLSVPTISRLCSGERGAGAKVIRAALRYWPELIHYLDGGRAARRKAS